MLLTFFGAIAVGVLAACVAFIVRHFYGVNARFLIPLSAGAGMLGFTVWNDYTWYGRNADGLPDTVQVARTIEKSWVVQPWTLVAPVVTRFQAVNLASVSRNVATPDVARATVYLVSRFQPTFETVQVFDCAGGRRSDAADAPGDGGVPPESAWVRIGLDDPLLSLVCGEARRIR
ncbi:MAG: hypothetical protein CVT86_03555 [Alphaproteobacteria bacterium HGW-Alphaproteobacteria-8]|nr:MAG: hypothetical protein CVT86_03555 [Alphaproteobacteria bacterium HGW-Alphaproteobacteria-8]